MMNDLSNTHSAPADRLLDIFEIIEHLPESELILEEQRSLLEEMARLAKKAKMNNPEGLAQQLLHMASDAKRRQLAEPGSQALHHARIAAKALILAQRKDHFSRNSHYYGLAASIFMFFSIGSLLLVNQSTPLSNTLAQANVATEILAVEQSSDNGYVGPVSAPVYNPKRMSDMIAKREMMRQGTCVFPEALMLPEADRSIYLKHVVKGDITSDYREQEIADRLMQTVRCNYSPMLMKNSVG